MSRKLSTLAVSVLALVVLYGFAGTAMAQDQQQVKCDPFINGIASFVIPGWGQWLNGDGGKAVFHVGAAVALGAATFLLAGTPASLLAALGAFVWHFYSAYDAFSNCVIKHEEMDKKSLIPALST